MVDLKLFEVQRNSFNLTAESKKSVIKICKSVCPDLCRAQKSHFKTNKWTHIATGARICNIRICRPSTTASIII
jgi:hypothetical protein